MAKQSIDSLHHSMGDYLASLAEGLADAQSQLDNMAENEARSGHRYHIPRLDFDLKLEFELSQSSADSDARPIRRLLVYQPGAETSRQKNFSGSSTLSGSILSVPNAQPEQLLDLSSELVARKAATESERHRVGVRVHVHGNDGEPLPDVAVEVNIDHQRSRELSEKLGGSYENQAVQLLEGLLISGPDGVAETDLLILQGARAPLQIVLMLDCQGQSETLRYRFTEES